MRTHSDIDLVTARQQTCSRHTATSTPHNISAPRFQQLKSFSVRSNKRVDDESRLKVATRARNESLEQDLERLTTTYQKLTSLKVYEIIHISSPLVMCSNSYKL